ncbi:MAG: type VI secretion system baseplate subunit TssG [Thermoguttaceae bacterium]|nr:type VI secretion system baseplate subunit TssG [Thermoguttaceae bacterium]
MSDDPTRFDFFQAVRVLEWLAREHAAGNPERMRRPVGEDHAPRQEVVRFRAVPSMSFPAGSIAALSPPQADDASAGPPEMAVAAMGLTGPSGALPHHYTSMLIERVRLKDFDEGG